MKSPATNNSRTWLEETANELAASLKKRVFALLGVLDTDEHLLHREGRLNHFADGGLSPIFGFCNFVAAPLEQTHGDEKIVRIEGLTFFSVAVNGRGDTPKNGDFGASGAQVKNTDFGDFASCVSRDFVLRLRFQRMTFGGCSLQKYYLQGRLRNSDGSKPFFKRAGQIQ